MSEFDDAIERLRQLLDSASDGIEEAGTLVEHARSSTRTAIDTCVGHCRLQDDDRPDHVIEAQVLATAGFARFARACRRLAEVLDPPTPRVTGEMHVLDTDKPMPMVDMAASLVRSLLDGSPAMMELDLRSIVDGVEAEEAVHHVTQLTCTLAILAGHLAIETDDPGEALDRAVARLQ